MKPEIIKYKNLWLTFSSLVIAASIFFIVQSCLVLGSPVKLGLDFTGGAKFEFQFSGAELSNKSTQLDSEKIEGILNEFELTGSNVQISPGADPILVLRTRSTSEDTLEKLETKLTELYGKFKVISIDSVSGLVGPELLRGGLIALLLTILGITLYISSRFQRDFAFCAIIALVHDMIVVIGLFAYLGLYHGVEVGSLFITAVLTVYGFSVHDTIVVFDRIRENQKMQSKNFGFEQVVDFSLKQVFARSLYTSLTVLTTLACLYVFGGTSTKLFVGAMFVGLFSGTYSSLFVASPLLIYWRKAFKA